MIGKIASYILWGLVGGIIGVGVSVAGNNIGKLDSEPALSPHVKVTYEDYGGYGSATHIGNGYFLTAAHVIKDGKVPLLDGERMADVLWVNKKYDVAFLRAYAKDMNSAPLDCREPDAGERVSLYGNPLNLESVTTWGQVSGSAREVGPWASVNPVNAAIAPGMSGGALIDEDGDLVGVNVGVMVMPVGFAGGPVGIGYSVPASVVCMLMGLDR